VGFDRRSITLTVPNPAATVEETFNLRSDYVRPLGFKIRLTGTSTTTKLRLTDADSRIFYLDGADKDYKTADIWYAPLGTDDVNTGLGPVPYDTTGVIVAAAQVNSAAVVKNPIKVAIINGEVAGDTIAFTLDYEYGVFQSSTFTMPVAVSSASTLNINLKSRYAQLLGLKVLSTGTSTTQTLRVKDADGRIVFLNAADVDYDTAAKDMLLFQDVTATNLTQIRPTNGTGVVFQAGIGRADPAMVRSPLTLDLTNSEGNDEIITGTIWYKIA
jgi:hypothetical protein